MQVLFYENIFKENVNGKTEDRQEIASTFIQP
jgi:hypothetical protein